MNSPQTPASPDSAPPPQEAGIPEGVVQEEVTLIGHVRTDTEPRWVGELLGDPRHNRGFRAAVFATLLGAEHTRGGRMALAEQLMREVEPDGPDADSPEPRRLNDRIAEDTDLLEQSSDQEEIRHELEERGQSMLDELEGQLDGGTADDRAARAALVAYSLALAPGATDKEHLLGEALQAARQE